MNKQLEKIQKTNVSSEHELNNLLNDDLSNCCPRRKRKSLFVRPTPAPVKRPNGGFVNVQQPPLKKPNLTYAKTIKSDTVSVEKPVPPARVSSPKPQSNSTNSEIVCTPDIMGLFDDEPSSLPDNTAPKVSPPPLVLRNNQKYQRAAQVIAPAVSPIFHNVNGFQVDLNHASRQEIFRLPNGKLIQVRKQTSAPLTNTGYRAPMIPRPPHPQFTIRQAAPIIQPGPRMAARIAPRMGRVGAINSMRPRVNQPQQRFTFEAGRVVASPHQKQAAPLPPIPLTTVFTQQNGSISVARAPQPNTPFGGAKTEFEDKIINGMEICQHTINKMSKFRNENTPKLLNYNNFLFSVTLTNSTSFKTLNNFSGLKELYIHLQYLFTYTSGKFKLLQESLTTGMESIAKFDIPKDNDDDELTIVEQKTDIIEVFSDDEEEITEKSKEAQFEAPIPIKKPIIKHIQYIPKKNPEAADPEAGIATIAIASVTDTLLSQVSIDQISEESNEPRNVEFVLDSDKKLENKVVVKVEKLEDSKNPVIKLFLKKLQERSLLCYDEMESAKSASSREATPDFCPQLLLNVSLEINEENDGSENEIPDAIDLEANKENVIDDDKEQSNEAVENMVVDEERNEISEVVKIDDIAVDKDKAVENMQVDEEDTKIDEVSEEVNINESVVDENKVLSNEEVEIKDKSGDGEEPKVDLASDESRIRIVDEQSKTNENIIDDEPVEGSVESKNEEVVEPTSNALERGRLQEIGSAPPAELFEPESNNVDCEDTKSDEKAYERSTERSAEDLGKLVETTTNEETSEISENVNINMANQEQLNNKLPDIEESTSPTGCNAVDFWSTTACDGADATETNKLSRNRSDNSDETVAPHDEASSESDNDICVDIDTFDSLLLSSIEAQERKNATQTTIE